MFILICCVGIVTLLVQSAAAQAGSKQNIILIIGDDIGWGDLGVYGGGEGRGIPTPNFDRQSGSYSGPITLQQYERFQYIRNMLEKEGIKIPIPTGN